MGLQHVASLHIGVSLMENDMYINMSLMLYMSLMPLHVNASLMHVNSSCANFLFRHVV